MGTTSGRIRFPGRSPGNPGSWFEESNPSSSIGQFPQHPRHRFSEEMLRSFEVDAAD
jgi:hypothetical protein